MTRSDPTQTNAATIIRRLVELLDEDHIAAMIDRPIDIALERFPCDDAAGYSHDRFHRTIAEFLRHLHESAFLCSRTLSPSQSLDEAVALLEQAYQGTYSDGYYAAVQDAEDPSQPGMEVVLTRLADLIKTRRRDMYTRWVIARHLDPADWHTKCALAAALIERCGKWLSGQLQNCTPDQLADSVPELLTIELATNGQFQPLDLST
ncbi:MAG: hypothetical protein HQ546_01265 [Planctomycetes bacterium]|nr:hypothetical protein [Planctomycetota bacterium]